MPSTLQTWVALDKRNKLGLNKLSILPADQPPEVSNKIIVPRYGPNRRRKRREMSENQPAPETNAHEIAELKTQIKQHKEFLAAILLLINNFTRDNQ